MRPTNLFFWISFLFFSAIVNAQQAPQITLQPIDQTVCLADSAGFIIQATGDGVLNYQWQKDDVDLPDETDSICIILSAFDVNEGNYKCIVSNEDGSDTTDLAILDVDVVLPTHIMGPREVENVDTVLYSVVTTPGHSYEFYITEGNVLESTDTTVLIEWGYDEVGYVRVLESNSIGCYGDTTSRLVIVGDVAPFILTQPVDQTVCLSDSTSFEIAAAGTSELNYQWQLDGKDIVRGTNKFIGISPVELDDEGYYTCIVSNNFGSDTCEPGLLDIDMVEAAQLLGPSSVDVFDTVHYTIIPHEGHSYEFSVSDGTMLAITDTSMTVLWDTTGICYVHLVETNTLGCIGDTNNYQILVFGEGMMVIILDEPESAGVCVTDSASFSVSAAGYPELIYQWQKNEVNIENATNSIYTILSAEFEDEAEYRCMVTNDFGTTASEIAFLSVDEIIPTSILGPQYVSEFEVSVYSVPFIEGHVYDFMVIGGNIIQSTQNSINVQWGASGYGFVQMIESVENGCIGELVELDIYVGTVGIQPEMETTERIHPNPVTDFVKIKLEGFNTLRLYDILGNLVLDEPFENELRINLSHLDQGMYIYRINDKTGKIIKN